MDHHPINYIIAILGGYIGAFSFFVNGHVGFSLENILNVIDYTELINYAVRSVFGAVLGIAVKLLYDLIIYGIKRIFKKGGSNE